MAENFSFKPKMSSYLGILGWNYVQRHNSDFLLQTQYLGLGGEPKNANGGVFESCMRLGSPLSCAQLVDKQSRGIIIYRLLWSGGRVHSGTILHPGVRTFDSEDSGLPVCYNRL